jgi:hypothetical protein
MITGIDLPLEDAPMGSRGGAAVDPWATVVPWNPPGVPSLGLYSLIKPGFQTEQTE